MLAPIPVVRLIRLVAVLTAAVVAIPDANARPGDIDPTFQYPRPSLFVPDAYNAVPVPGGWLTVRFAMQRSPIERTTLTLTRIDQDGRLVEEFGDGGRLIQELPGLVDASAVMKRLSDGKILLGGFIVGPDGRGISAVVRLDKDGRIDPAFLGRGGLFTFDLPGDGDQIGALDVLADGRIVAAVYTRIDPFDYFECVRDRVTLVSLPDAFSGGPIAVVQTRDRDTFRAVACRTPITLQVGPDGRILYGSEVGVFRGDTALAEPSIVEGPANGPFASDDKYVLVYTLVDGDGFAVRTLSHSASSPTQWYRGLGQSSGMPAWVTWSRMAVDAERNFAYAGFAAGDGDIAIARFKLPSGELDTGWGGGDGIVTLARVTGSAPYYFYGYSIGTEVRLIDVQPNGDIVVATADGLVARILGGQEVQHGAFTLVGTPGLIERTRQRLQIRVQRLAGESGAVSVDYTVAAAACDDPLRTDCLGGFGSAIAGEDFLGASGTLTWIDGDATDRFIDVEILAPQNQPSEVFSVKLMNPTGGAGMIVDNSNIYLAGPAQPTVQSPPDPPAPTSPADSRSSGGGAASWPLVCLLLFAALVATRNRHRWQVARMEPRNA